MLPCKTRPARALKVCTCKTHNLLPFCYFTSVCSQILQECFTVIGVIIHRDLQRYHVRHALHVQFKFARAKHVISDYIVIMYPFAPRFYRLAVTVVQFDQKHRISSAIFMKMIWVELKCTSMYPGVFYSISWILWLFWEPHVPVVKSMQAESSEAIFRYVGALTSK